jgi:hypothetical protein
MKIYLSLLLLLLSPMLAGKAYAEIYKRVDANGRVTYSNEKTKGATRLDFDLTTSNINSSRNNIPTNKRSATPESFPRVDKNTQSLRDDKRRDILQSELAAEKSALAQAQKAYTAGESNPEVFVTPAGATFRNVNKFQEKMQPLQADVDSHQKNIELLQKEIDALK